MGQPEAGFFFSLSIEQIIVTISVMDQDPICTICFEKFRWQQEAKRVQCKHVFIQTALKNWIQSLIGFNDKQSCPNCRHALDGVKFDLAV